MPSLFNCVLAIGGLAQQETKVLGLRTTFVWQENMGEKSIMLKRDVEDSFKIFLEFIDASPCWKEDPKRCNVVVEVVMA